jgi:putative transposase
MQRHQQEFRLTRMCAVLHVSRSGFYAWQRRETSARTQANQRLIERMRVLHQQTREAYGARKMWQLLTREGLVCGRHRVARLRRLAGIVALRRKRYIRMVQVRQHETPAIPNRLNQQFAVSARDKRYPSWSRPGGWRGSADARPPGSSITVTKGTSIGPVSIKPC